MLRYLRRLADRDYALDRGMIPLGSCTMKLNATTEMEPISNPGFAQVHPFAPADQFAGYTQLFADLQGWLAEITGYDAISLQPNAGSQGEFAGLLAIHNFHRANGDDHRDVCLIPASAHGTNAASAVMAGLRVVVVKTGGEQGEIDLADLRAKIAEHADSLAAIMVTYPSTHGVFEDHIGEICALVHDAGGQVYVDGANLNAMVGPRPSGQVRRGRVAPEPAQDVLHPARRRRPGCRADRCPGTSRAVPAEPPAAARGRPGDGQRRHRRRAVGLGVDPADHLGLHPADGSGRADRGDRRRDPVRQLRRPPAAGALPGALHRRRTGSSPTSASSTCARSPARPE